MRLTKENIDKYLDSNGNLNLWCDKDITHIDYIPDKVKYIIIAYSNIEEITCKLPEGLEQFYCQHSILKSLPLLPKSLITFDGRNSNLPKEFKVNIYNDKIKCNRLRKLQMINSI